MDTGINTSKKVIHKAVKTTGKFLGNKIADAVTNSYNDKIVQRKPDEEIIIPLGKKRRNINESRQVL